MNREVRYAHTQMIQPVLHLSMRNEAGLFNKKQDPHELTRLKTQVVADLRFTPTEFTTVLL